MIRTNFNAPRGFIWVQTRNDTMLDITDRTDVNEKNHSEGNFLIKYCHVGTAGDYTMGLAWSKK
jgi:hypothetical protein